MESDRRQENQVWKARPREEFAEEPVDHTTLGDIMRLDAALAAVTLGVVLATIGSRVDGTLASKVGFFLVPCFGAAGLMVLVNWASHRPVPRWVHWVGVPAVGAALSLLVSAG